MVRVNVKEIAWTDYIGTGNKKITVGPVFNKNFNFVFVLYKVILIIVIYRLKR